MENKEEMKRESPKKRVFAWGMNDTLKDQFYIYPRNMYMTHCMTHTV